MSVVFDPLLGQLRTADAAGGGGSGTVASVSVVSANGLAGTVANPTTTPAITLSTSITGVLKGNGTAISAAVSGTDYSLGTSANATGIVKSTTTTGALTTAVAADFPTLNQNTTGSAALNVLKTGDTMTGDLTISKSAPALYLTDTAQTAPAGRYRVDTSGDLLRFIRSASVLGSLSNAGLFTATTFSGAGTNLTGTAASLTAGNVTTNANLTGPITSSGNATSIASQTGTGTKFVVDTSPALTGTPTAPTPTAGDSTTQLATTAFVQMAVRSVPSKEASKYATTAALATVTYYNGVAGDGVGATLTGVGLGAITLDGNTPIVGDRLLVKNQVSTFQNGIYTVTVVGTAGTVFVITRALDFNQTGDIKTGATTYVTSGATLAATTWDVNSADSPVMGTDAITFIQSAGPGSLIAGTGIGISGSTVAIDTSVTVDKTTAQTLTNKTLTAPAMSSPTVSTTTVVTNLNADTVDGIHASATPVANQLLALDGSAKLPSSALSNPYKFRVYRTAVQTMGGIGTNTKIAFDTKSYDTSSNFDVVTNNRFVAPIAGFYAFTARTLVITVGANGQFQLWKNGALVSRGTNVIGDYPGIAVIDYIQLAASDYIEVYFNNGASNTPPIQAGDATGTYFSGFLVSTL